MELILNDKFIIRLYKLERILMQQVDFKDFLQKKKEFYKKIRKI